MRSKDLMIGDWVLINEVPKKIQAVDGVDDEIMADDEMYCLVEDRCHSEDKVTGIPLTQEILEKNGFSRNGLDIALFDRKGGDDFVGASNLQYVHELQHDLRLCGIEKEIEL